MAFPTTSDLDDFNRSNNASLGSNWAEGVPGLDGGDNFEINTNQCRNLGGGQTQASARWSAASFGPDSEVFCDIPSPDPEQDGDRFSIVLKISDIGASTTNAYYLSLRRAGGGLEYRIGEITDGSTTDIGAAVSLTFNSDDRMGLEAIGSTLKGYRFDGTSWSEVLSRTDSTLQSVSGNIGLMNFEDFQDNVPKLDNFGGGTVVVDASLGTSQARVGRQTQVGRGMGRGR